MATPSSRAALLAAVSLALATPSFAAPRHSASRAPAGPSAADLAPPTSANAVRGAVGKPLERAKTLLAQKNFRGAMDEVNRADAVRGKTPFESFVIEQMRGAVAQASGDRATARRTYQTLIDSGRVPASELVKLLMAEASMAYEDKDYAAAVSWIDRYTKAGGKDPAMHTLLIQSYYQNKDYANAAKLQAADIAAAEKARQKPPEGALQLLAACQEALGDKAGFASTMQKLVWYYPKADYWANFIRAVQTRQGGLPDRLTLDLDRVRLYVGLITKPEQYTDMAELALTQHAPGEAQRILDQGFNAKVLGTGPDADRQNKLRVFAQRSVEERRAQLGKDDAAAAGDHDGNRLEQIAEEYISFGMFDKGIPMLQQAIAKDQLRHPEDAKLHLAVAYIQAGRKAEAMTTLRTIHGTDGTADIAKLWMYALR